MKPFKINKEKSSKQEKLVKLLGEDTVQELESLDLAGLNKRIAEANAAISNTKAELEENAEYKQIKEDKKLLESGLSEVKKRQNAIIKLSLVFRQTQGAV